MINPVYRACDERYENGMSYRRCGNSGIKLPAISLGLWHNFGDVDSLAFSEKKIHFAFDHGICHFDLANNYGPSYGSAEETFGQIMSRSMRPYRDEMLISTKAGYDMWPGPYGEWGSRKYLISSLNRSLQRMKLEYVDIFYSHRFDPNTPLEETMQALADIVHAGKALYVGISNYPEQAAQSAYEYLQKANVPCLIYQGKYSIFNTNPAKEGILSGAKDNGVGFIAYSPLAQGLLSDRYLNGIPADSRIGRGGHLKEKSLTPETLNIIRRLNEIALSRSQSLAEMALAWLLAQPEVTSVLIGASSTEQIADNLKALNNTCFSPEEISAINALSN